MLSNGIAFFLLFLMILMGIFCILFLRNMVDPFKRANPETVYLKILTSSCFVIVGIAMSCCRTYISNFCLFLISGAFASLIGDFLLGLRYVDIERRNSYTRGGFIAFMIGHFLYITYNIIRFGSVLFNHLMITIVFLLLALVLGLAVGRCDRLLGMTYGDFKFLVTIYSIIILASTFLGFEIAILKKFNSLLANFFAVGASFFLISDLILSGTYFGQGKDRPVDLISNHIFYFTGQFLIGLALLL